MNMKHLIYTALFSGLLFNVLPIKEVWGMAQGVISPSYHAGSMQSSCFEPSSFSLNDNTEINLQSVFGMYGSAARGGLCAS